MGSIIFRWLEVDVSPSKDVEKSIKILKEMSVVII